MFEIAKRRKEVANLFHSNAKIKQEEIEIVDHIKQELMEEDDYITKNIANRHVDLLLKTAELRDKQTPRNAFMTNVRNTTDSTTTTISPSQIIKDNHQPRTTHHIPIDIRTTHLFSNLQGNHKRYVHANYVKKGHRSRIMKPLSFATLTNIHSNQEKVSLQKPTGQHIQQPRKKRKINFRIPKKPEIVHRTLIDEISFDRRPTPIATNQLYLLMETPLVGFDKKITPKYHQ